MDVFLDRLLTGKCGESSPLMQLAEEVDCIISKRNSWGTAGVDDRNSENLCPNSSANRTGRVARGISAEVDGLEGQMDELAESPVERGPLRPESDVCRDSCEVDALACADGEGVKWQEQGPPSHSVVDGVHLARSLFVLDPLQLHLPDMPFPPAQLPGSLYGPLWDEGPDEQLCRAEKRQETQPHHDDCTPSSGLDYLIEVQNPTWEAAVYNRLLLALHALHNTATTVHSSPRALEHFSRSFASGMMPAGKESTVSTGPADQIANQLAAAGNLVSAGRIVEAIPLLEMLTKNHSPSCDAWMLLALARYFSQNDTAAVSACKRYICLHRGSPDSSSSMVLLLLATCLSNEGDLPAMHSVVFQWMIDYLAVTDEIVRGFLPLEDSTTTLCDVNVPRLLTEIGRSFLAHMHNDGSLLWALAILEFSQGNYAVAGRHFESVLQQNPSSPSVLNQIGACLHNLRQFERALQLQDRVLTVCPNFPRAQYNKALTLFATGVPMTALRLLQTGLHLQRSHNVQETEQFWYLAARIIPRLPAQFPEQHSLRVRLMSAVLARDIQLYGALLDDVTKTLAS